MSSARPIIRKLYRQNKMAQRAAGHVKKLQVHHRRHRQRLLKLFHRVRSHPSCYKAGYVPKRGRVPKSLPRKPSGLNRKGSGLWDHVKKAWNWITGKAKKHGKAIYAEGKKHLKKHGKALLEEGKKRATAYGKQALARGTEWAKGQALAVGQNMRNKVEGYVKAADKKVQSAASRVDAAISKRTGGVGAMPGRVLKKGSGVGRRGMKLDKYVRKVGSGMRHKC